MNYNASGFDKTIGSKSTIVPSDHQLEYKDGQTLRFEVPNGIDINDYDHLAMAPTENEEGSDIW